MAALAAVPEMLMVCGQLIIILTNNQGLDVSSLYWSATCPPGYSTVGLASYVYPSTVARSTVATADVSRYFAVCVIVIIDAVLMPKFKSSLHSESVML